MHITIRTGEPCLVPVIPYSVIMAGTSSVWWRERKFDVLASFRLSLAWATAILALVPAGWAKAAPCGNMTLRFFDNVPAPSIFVEPSEPKEHPEHEIAQLQISPDGSRSMSSPFWAARYRILPLSDSAHTTTGEAYWFVDRDSPLLEIEFQRDIHGRVAREILLSPRPPNQPASEKATRIQGWYEYSRDDLARVIKIIFHSKPLATDGRWWITDDNFILSWAELSYENGERNPSGATIFYDIGGGQPVRFDYDTQGRLTGGFRQDYLPTYFTVTGGACSEVPERLFVLLLGPHGGPWHPYYLRRSAHAAGPR